MTRQRYAMILAVVFATVTFGLVGLAAAQQKVPPPIEKRTQGAPPTFPSSRPTLADLTPEERERLKNMTGSAKITWSEFLIEWNTPRSVPKDSVVMVDEKYGYPHIAVSFKMEVVPTPEGEEEDPNVVWMRGIPPEDPQSPLHKMWEDRQAREIYFKMQQAWEEEHGDDEFFVDFDTEPVPAPFADSMTFESAMEGLPADGRWQMNFAIEDMNADGHVDLVFPPTRKGPARPMIFLGQGDGRFEFWKNNRWSNKVPIDYGGVATGDFDGDGHQDVVLAIHFKGQYVFYGDGKGDFSRSLLLPSPDPRITSRAPTSGDFDGDGLTDIAFLAEIDYDLATNARIEKTTTVWVVYSRGNTWELPRTLIMAGVIGDNLTCTDANDDGRLDLVVASNATNFRRLILLNGEDGSWKQAARLGVLSNSLHTDVAVSPDRKDLFSVFVQFLYVGEKNLARTGIIRYPITDGGISTPGEPIFFDDKRFDSYFRLGVGDLNGDGLTDVVAGRKNGGVEVYVQVEGGGFYQESGEELDVERGTPFDIQLMDLDGDNRDDIIATFADKDERKGGVRIWMSRAKN